MLMVYEKLAKIADGQGCAIDVTIRTIEGKGDKLPN